MRSTHIIRSFLAILVLSFVTSTWAGDKVPFKLGAQWIPSDVESCSEFVTTESSIRLRAKMSREFVADQILKIREAQKDPTNPKKQDEARLARWELGIFTREEAHHYQQLSAVSNETIDDVFAGNQKNQTHASVTGSQNLEIISEQPLYVQLYNNIQKQISSSKLFNGFTNPDFSVSIQYLKIKKYSDWPENAKAAFKTIMIYHNDYQRESFGESWIYAFFDKDRNLPNFAGAKVIGVVMDKNVLLKPLHSGNIRPLSLDIVNHTPFQSLEVMHTTAGFYPMRPTLAYSEGIGPSGNLSEMFYLPMDIIDWQDSVFRISMTKQAPQPPGSVAVKYHIITLLASNLGKDVVLIGGNSGSILEALKSGRVSDNLPQHWDQVPMKFRRVPQNQLELEEYLRWARTAVFEGNRLNGNRNLIEGN
jgi:hypothetical protein